MIFFYLLVALMPFVRHFLWNDTKFFGLTLNKGIGIVCFLIAVEHLLSRSTPVRLLHRAPPRLYVVFGLATMVSFLLVGPSVDVEVSPIGTWVSLFLFFLASLSLLDSIEKLRYTLLALIGGVAYASLYTIKEWVNGGMLAGDRPGWVTGDPNYFALSALLCLPLNLVLPQVLGRTWERVLCWVCLPV